MDFVSGLCCLLAAYVFFRLLMHTYRKQRLMKKYGDSEVVRRIMEKTIWEGMTSEQLADCLGRPLDIDERLTRKSMTKTLKYRRIGRGRYGTRVTVRDGRVIGWDVK